jgi:hypothetical protein
MAELNLTQDEADALLAMEKISVDDKEWSLPDLGGKLSVPLVSVDKKEHFHLDITKGRINLQKGSYQNRSRDALILVRMCIGKTHWNPPELGGNQVGVPHIHIYKEGFGDKWALELPEGFFSNLNDSWQVLMDFMKYCNISKVPNFRRGLFS